MSTNEGQELPTILLLPGSFTTPACFDWLAPHLEDAGYPIAHARLVTTAPRDPERCTAEQEGLSLVNNHLKPLIEDGKSVLVFAHSFGATSCSGADDGLTKSARESKGLRGGVIGIVWISCAFPHDGQSQQEYLGAPWPDFCKLDTPSKGLLVFDPAGDLLYNDVEEPLKSDLVKGHLPQAIRVFETPVRKPLWTDPSLDGKRVYIRTMRDGTFPPEAQTMFVENCGVKWDVVDVDGGHCAFISRPVEVAKAVLDAAKKWS